ncbi:hypothetical protein HYQ45_002915 [Verticillium longisporum]|uniref:Uncharacterized protein n=2 Tax=Verticillium longisporum TaxID=100787 RepID=A0A8I2ZW56_VERLO|nr:hypothetical protein HYQ45_002915 [Verticillium longisporum]
MSHKPKDPLDQLQYMLNDVIIQIGKALKASTKQPNRQNVSQIHASLQTRMPETIEHFHWALNDLESEVMRAKGALQRDLDRLQQRRAPQPEEAIKASPAPMIASPASVTLVVASPELAQKSPPSPPLKEEPTQSAPFSAAQESPAPPPMAPMAPIPDMGGNDSMPTPVQPKADIKREPTPSVPQAMMAPMDSIPVKSEETPATSSVAPEPSMSTAPEAPMDDLFDLSGGENEGGGGNGSEFDFTDITFGLDPSVDSQSQPTADVAPQPDMSTTSGLPATAEMSTLDGLLPVAAPVQSAATTASTAMTNTEPPKVEGDQKTGDPQSTAAVDNDIFDLDGIGGNMDLDMNLGNNGDGSSFDDMFYGGDNMEDVQFDDAFFGLSN